MTTLCSQNATEKRIGFGAFLPDVAEEVTFCECKNHH